MHSVDGHHRTHYRCNGSNSVAKVAGKAVSHKTSSTRSCTINPVWVNIVLTQECVNQVGNEIDICHEVRRIKVPVVCVWLRSRLAVRVHYDKICSIRYLVDLGSQHRIRMGWLSMKNKKQRHRGFLCVVNCRDINAIGAFHSAAHDGVLDGLLRKRKGRAKKRHQQEEKKCAHDCLHFRNGELNG